MSAEELMVLEKTLESLLDGKEIKPVNLKGNQCWIFIGRTNAKAEAPVLLPLDAKNWLIGKDPDAGKDWRQEEKETTGWDVGWHHWLNGHEFEQARGVGDGQGGLDGCSPWGRKELETTEHLNWAELKMATIKKMDNNKHWQGYEETGTLLHWWWIVKWYGHFGEQFGLSSKKVKHRVAQWPQKSTPRYISKVCPIKCVHECV